MTNWRDRSVAVFAMTACKPKPRYQMVGEPSPEQPPATSSLTSPAQLPTPSPLPSQPSEGQAPGLATLASSVRPAIILVTVFDASGKLLRTGTGFFVADDGKFVTNWRTAEGGAYAVAKMGDGAICNVTGILASSTTLDLAVLKADVKGVPFLALNKIGKTDRKRAGGQRGDACRRNNLCEAEASRPSRGPARNRGADPGQCNRLTSRRWKWLGDWHCDCAE